MTYEELDYKFLKIKELCKIKNWNGYDADPISDITIDRAKNIALLLFNPKISVYPTAADSIQIEFGNENAYVEIQVLKTAKKYIAKLKKNKTMLL